ncbi:hypothetical protein VL15_15310 [Burkholderia cepacia]|uniref:Fis family transcriptional regulator n=2 Tax=Burkholderia cepacia TaxID=292 RepID=A0A0J5WZ18_BURCE|nr:hypothetical protein VL15_15310 [Burkholderia cepacia]
MRRTSTRRASRRPLTKNLLLPMSPTRVRALSLEHHLALATVACGRGNVDLMVCLLKAVYMTFYLRGETSVDVDMRAVQRAEAALERCTDRAERGETWIMLDTAKSAIERVLLLHDAQLATTPTHRYLDALDKLNRFACEGLASPIPAIPPVEA